MKKNENQSLASAWIVLGVLARMLPFPANVSPLTSISVFGGAELPRGRAFFLTFTVMVLSDLLLSLAYGYPAFGSFTFFTYSGFAAIILAGSSLRGKATAPRVITVLLASSLGFWLWTNFGVWATGGHGMYPRNLDGMIACYAAAIPFLRNAIVGDLAWGFVFFAGFAASRNFALRVAGATKEA